MSRTFCCCLPVRFGVLVLSLLQVLFAGAFAGLVWYGVIKSDQLNEEANLRTAAIIAGAVYSAMALAAFLGLLGAIFRSRPLVAIYSTVLYVMIALSTAVGSYFIFRLYQDGDKLRADCEREANKVQDKINTEGGRAPDIDLNTNDICDGLFSTAKWSFIVSLVISVLISLYCAYIVSQYVRQLGEEQSYRSAQHNWAGTAPATSYGNVPAASYYPHQPLHGAQNESLLHPTTGYEYTDKTNAFGAHHSRTQSKEIV